MAYDEMVADGTYPVLAATLACQKFANIGTTDKTFNKREHERMSKMDEGQREVIAAIARKAGINTTGKTYNGQLGKYNDPNAWVSGTSDVIQAANAKGLSIRGMVNVENEQRPIAKKRIAPDILDGLELRERKRNPAIDSDCTKNPKKRVELREKLTEKHTK